MGKIKSKRCAGCKERLSIDKFYKNDRYCKKCRKAYMKKYNDDNYKLKLGMRNWSPKRR